MKKTFVLSPVLCFYVLFLLGCFSPSQMTFSNSEKWLPENFNPKDGILLVEEYTWTARQAKIIKEYMQENYPYKYEFVSKGDLDKNSKYSDKSLYRFAIVTSYGVERMHQDRDYNQQLPVTMVDFNFYDRLDKKAYPKTGRGSSYPSMTFKPFINTIVKQFQ